jgi:dTMP kinase
MINRGKFIAFEGIDGAGKSTLIKLINEKYKSLGIKTYLTAQPTKNYIGTSIRNILTGIKEGDERTIAALFLADRIDHITHSEYGIMQFIDKGFYVLCDRYYLSSYAYHVPYVTMDWVIEANSICANLCRPDYTFYIDISVEVSMQRLTQGRATLERFENIDRITQVKSNYEEAIRRVSKDENIIRIDGNRSIDEIIEDIYRALALT